MKEYNILQDERELKISDLIEMLQNVKDKEGDILVYATYIISDPTAVHGLTLHQSPIAAIMKMPYSTATVLHGDSPETIEKFKNQIDNPMVEEL